MTDHPDGNTAALRQHESSEARAEEIYEAYAERVIEGVVDDVMVGVGIRLSREYRLTAYDFIAEMLGDDFICPGDIVQLLLYPSLRKSTTDRLTTELATRVVAWCKDTTRGQDLVMERCREWDREEMGES